MICVFITGYSLKEGIFGAEKRQVTTHSVFHFETVRDCVSILNLEMMQRRSVTQFATLPFEVMMCKSQDLDNINRTDCPRRTPCALIITPLKSVESCLGLQQLVAFLIVVMVMVFRVFVQGSVLVLSLSSLTTSSLIQPGRLVFTKTKFCLVYPGHQMTFCVLIPFSFPS